MLFHILVILFCTASTMQVRLRGALVLVHAAGVPLAAKHSLIRLLRRTRSCAVCLTRWQCPAVFQASQHLHPEKQPTLQAEGGSAARTALRTVSDELVAAAPKCYTKGLMLGNGQVSAGLIKTPIWDVHPPPCEFCSKRGRHVGVPSPLGLILYDNDNRLPSLLPAAKVSVHAAECVLGSLVDKC